jgi:hypothetical protein
MKSKKPVIWDRHPDLKSMVDGILKETIPVQLDDELYLSTRDATTAQAVAALEDADILGDDATPLSSDILPTVALRGVEYIDGGPDGPTKQNFVKKFALMKQENPSLWKELGGENPTQTREGPGVGTVSIPAGSEWILNIRGGPQPSIGKGEILFGMMMGLSAGGGTGEDEADLQDASGNQYHMKYYGGDTRSIQGPTNSNIEKWIDFTYPESQAQNPLSEWIREQMVNILTTGTTYSPRIEALTLPEELSKFESNLLEIKAIVAWYVATAAKMSLIRDEDPNSGPDKYIVNLIRDAFRIVELSPDLSKQPYPTQRAGDGRISYGYHNTGPVKFIFDNFMNIARMSSSQISQLVNSINSGDSSEATQLTRRTSVDWDTLVKDTAGKTPSKFLKEMLRVAYLDATGYLVNNHNINAAFDHYVINVLAGEAPIKKFLDDTNVGKSTKAKFLNMLADKPASDKSPERAADPLYLEFFANSDKIDEFLEAIENDQEAQRSSSAAQDLLEKIMGGVETSGKIVAGPLLAHKIRRILTLERALNEELTRADKKEVDRMIAKRIEKDRTEQKKIIRKEIESELKSSLGTSFFGNPGKVRKAIEEIARAELSREMGRGSKMEEQVVEITKKIIKKLYREISHAYNPVIDRIKL